MENEKTSMDRRSFLKGAFATGAVATAAVTGVGTLAGCAAQPKEGKAGTSASDGKAAGGTYDFETAPDPIAEGDIKETWSSAPGSPACAARSQPPRTVRTWSCSSAWTTSSGAAAPSTP